MSFNDQTPDRNDELITLHAGLVGAASQFRLAFRIMSEANSFLGSSTGGSKALAALDQQFSEMESAFSRIIDEQIVRVREMIREKMDRPD